MADTDPLRRICQRYGPVEISYIAANSPFCWTVALMSTHDGVATWNHTHGERLEAAILDLQNQLDRNGVMTLAEAMRIGTVQP